MGKNEFGVLLNNTPNKKNKKVSKKRLTNTTKGDIINTSKREREDKQNVHNYNL